MYNKLTEYLLIFERCSNPTQRQAFVFSNKSVNRRLDTVITSYITQRLSLKTDIVSTHLSAMSHYVKERIEQNITHTINQSAVCLRKKTDAEYACMLVILIINIRVCQGIIYP